MSGEVGGEKEKRGEEMRENERVIQFIMFGLVRNSMRKGITNFLFG